MNWQQFLTERVLGECWHEWIKRPEVGLQAKCSCGMLYDVTSYNRADILYIHRNRTFDNRNDLMDLCQKVYKDGKWESFEEYQFNYWDDLFPFQKEHKVGFLPWLFCLKGECYTLGCKAVAEFYGWGEQRDPVIDKNSGAYGDN